MCVPELFNTGWSSLENEIADELVRRRAKKSFLGDSWFTRPRRTRRMRVVYSFYFWGLLMSVCLITTTIFWAVTVSTTAEPTERNEMIDAKIKSYHLGIHFIVWPVIVTVKCCAWILFFAYTCGCKYTCKATPPHDVQVMAATLEQNGVYTLQELNPEERQRILRECAPADEPPEDEPNASVV